MEGYNISSIFFRVPELCVLIGEDTVEAFVQVYADLVLTMLNMIIW